MEFGKVFKSDLLPWKLLYYMSYACHFVALQTNCPNCLKRALQTYSSHSNSRVLNRAISRNFGTLFNLCLKLPLVQNYDTGMLLCIGFTISFQSTSSLTTINMCALNLTPFSKGCQWNCTYDHFVKRWFSNSSKDNRKEKKKIITPHARFSC